MSKKELTGGVTVVVGMFIAMGWIFLPADKLYKSRVGDNVVYTDLANEFMYIGSCIFILCTVFAMYKFGEYLYYRFSKPKHNMLICSIVREGGNAPKLVIQPEVTDGGEEIEIPVSDEMAVKLEALEELSNERE